LWRCRCRHGGRHCGYLSGGGVIEWRALLVCAELVTEREVELIRSYAVLSYRLLVVRSGENKKLRSRR